MIACDPIHICIFFWSNSSIVQSYICLLDEFNRACSKVNRYRTTVWIWNIYSKLYNGKREAKKYWWEEKKIQKESKKKITTLTACRWLAWQLGKTWSKKKLRKKMDRFFSHLKFFLPYKVNSVDLRTCYSNMTWGKCHLLTSRMKNVQIYCLSFKIKPHAKAGINNEKFRMKYFFVIVRSITF